jgi:signal transduction histidine kinase
MSVIPADPESVRRTLLMDRLREANTLGEGLRHEVRNPLNGALLQLALLARRLPEPDCLPAKVQPIADLVEHALRRLETLFNDVAFLLQAGTPESVPLALADCRQTTVTLVQTIADAAVVRLPVDLALKMPPLESIGHLLLATVWPEMMGPRNLSPGWPGTGRRDLKTALGASIGGFRGRSPKTARLRKDREGKRGAADQAEAAQISQDASPGDRSGSL